jgi:hypothetical protein
VFIDSDLQSYQINGLPRVAREDVGHTAEEVVAEAQRAGGIGIRLSLPMTTKPNVSDLAAIKKRLSAHSGACLSRSGSAC